MRAGERGQSTVEYVGLILLVATILVAVGSAGLGPRFAGAARAAVCEVAGLRCAPVEVALAVVERYIRGDLDEFLAFADAADHDPRLDYSTDGCSAPVIGNRGISFDFTDACRRHDFGYRNAKRLGAFRALKIEIDKRFYRDMLDHCATRSFLLRLRCREWAFTYYTSVRAFG